MQLTITDDGFLILAIFKIFADSLGTPQFQFLTDCLQVYAQSEEAEDSYQLRDTEDTTSAEKGLLVAVSVSVHTLRDEILGKDKNLDSLVVGYESVGLKILIRYTTLVVTYVPVPA